MSYSVLRRRCARRARSTSWGVLALACACTAADASRHEDVGAHEVAGTDAAAPRDASADATTEAAIGPCGYLGRAQLALSVVDRNLVGDPSAYSALAGLQAPEPALAGSQRLRREAAWRVVERVLAPVPLARRDLPSAGDATLPAFRTWYAKDDLTRIFRHFYAELTPNQRAARVPFSPSALALALAWNNAAIAAFSEWTPERLAEYTRAIDEPSELAGLGGIYRVVYNADASRHLLASYPQILACRDGAPLASAPREELTFSGRIAATACEPWELAFPALGPEETLELSFQSAASGAAITVEGSAEQGDAILRCEARSAVPCTVAGPGAFRLRAHSETGELAGELSVRRRRPAWAPCLAEPFPEQAVLVKASWRRAELGTRLPVYETSADALRRRLSGTDTLSWETPDGDADPRADQIYTVKLPNENVFRLAALHVMSKAFDHWLWITLWWSPSPDQDFGSDRPATLAEPWRHYKMCAVSAFAELDPSATGGYESEQPSLAQALAVTYAGAGAPTWCSNPYLEEGPGNAATNCIGCHQHAGTLLRPEQILGEPLRFPEQGRSALRASFPSDYAYSVTAGDDLSAVFAETESHFTDR